MADWQPVGTISFDMPLESGKIFMHTMLFLKAIDAWPKYIGTMVEQKNIKGKPRIVFKLIQEK